MRTAFFRLLDSDDKAADLLNAVRDPANALGRQVFLIDAGSFKAIPRSPFAYWVSDRLRQLFADLPTFDSPDRTATIGASTKNDSRYARLWFEVPPSSVARTRDETALKRWVLYAKGGVFARFYADIHLVVNWSGDGRELKADITEYRGSRGWGYQWSAALNGHSHYFRCGLTWPHRSARFSAAVLPAGCIFSNSGKAAFAQSGELDWLLGLFNSAAMSLLLRVQSDAVRIKYEVGLLQRTPYPTVSPEQKARVGALAREGWLLRRGLDSVVETSHVFLLPALLRVSEGDIATRARAWGDRVDQVDLRLDAIQAEIDNSCCELFGLTPADLNATLQGWSASAGDAESDEVGVDADEDVEEESETQRNASDATQLAVQLVSWAVGVAFGRFDVRVAAEQPSMGAAPDLFEPLEVCSPGMLKREDGLPAMSAPNSYPLVFPESGVLVDDPGHTQDLTECVRRVFDVVFAGDADHWWSAVSTSIDPKGQDLRSWLSTDFFQHHIKLYSRNRRKGPIFWQLGIPSGRYSVWLYAHRLTRDSLFQVQAEVLSPKVAHEERALLSLVQAAGPSPSASQRRQIEAQQSLLDELRQMLEEVKRVAPLWNPVLDDGSLLSMAPLWRLFPQLRTLQREVKKKWDELAEGKLDWAQIAMHLWPERVVPLCQTDRSLAIAHGLEGAFWVESSDGKWSSRTALLLPLDELVRQRSSAAVKSALADLQQAGATNLSTGQARRKVAS